VEKDSIKIDDVDKDNCQSLVLQGLATVYGFVLALKKVALHMLPEDVFDFSYLFVTFLNQQNEKEITKFIQETSFTIWSPDTYLDYLKICEKVFSILGKNNETKISKHVCFNNMPCLTAFYKLCQINITKT